MEEETRELSPAEELAMAKYRHAVLSLVLHTLNPPLSGEGANPGDWAHKYTMEAARIVGVPTAGRPFADVLQDLAAGLVKRGTDEQDVRLRVLVKRLSRCLRVES